MHPGRVAPGGARHDDRHEWNVGRDDAWDGRYLAARPRLPGAWDRCIHQVSPFLRVSKRRGD